MSATLAALSPISLDELTENAALQTRVDRKYIVSRAELDEALSGLPHNARLLRIDGVSAFDYESVYFDTPDLASYFMAAQPRRRRFKIRTRSYLDSDEAYLEVKTRGGRSVTVKDRLPYNIADRRVLTEDGRAYADEVMPGLGSLDLGEVMTTRYARTTLYLPGSQSRATVDTDLEWIDSTGPRLSLPSVAIVETKSGSRASEVDRLLWSHGHRPSTISKYGTGLAALRPDLPSNKWARVLRTHFYPHPHTNRASS